MTLNERTGVKSNITSGFLEHDFLYDGNIYWVSTGNNKTDILAAPLPGGPQYSLQIVSVPPFLVPVPVGVGGGVRVRVGVRIDIYFKISPRVLYLGLSY